MLQHITVKDYDSKVFWVSRPDKANRSVDHPAPHEAMRGQRDRFDRRSHDRVWPERRLQVMTEWAHSVLRFLEPIGYVGPTEEGASLTELTSTQCMVHHTEHRMMQDCVPAEVAPEWLRLQANGIDCVSMYSEYTDEEGETHEMELADAEWLCSEAIAQTLDANVEAFIREHDRKLWYSTRPKVAYEVVNDQSKRGLVPKTNHPWTYEELKASMALMGDVDSVRVAMQRRNDTAWHKERAFRGPRALLTQEELAAAKAYEPVRRFIESLPPDRDDLMAEWDQELYDAKQGKPYIATEECPNCVDGLILDANGDSEDCPVCGGKATVLACLGFDGLPVADPTEPEPELTADEENDRYNAPSLYFIRYLYDRVAW